MWCVPSRREERRRILLDDQLLDATSKAEGNGRSHEAAFQYEYSFAQLQECLEPHLQLGDVQLRLLASLDPNVLALVKAPYRSLIGLVWPIAGCCGVEGEGSLAFFFGDATLFDLEEIEGELTLPITERFTLSLSIGLPMTSQPTFTLAWQWDSP